MNLTNNLSSKFINRMFRKIEGLVWDLTSGNVGIQDKDGIYTLSSATTTIEGTSTVSYGVAVNPFDSFAYALPAFATNTPFDQVNEGDLIVGAEKVLGWVVKKNPASLTLLDKNGMTKQYTPPKVTIMDMGNGVLVVRSLLSTVGGEGNLNNLQNNLLPLLLMKDGGSMEDLLPLMLLQGGNLGGGQAGGINPMMFMMMAGKGGSAIDDMLPLMLLQGQSQANGGLFQTMMMMQVLGGDKKGSAPALSASAPALNVGAVKAGTPPLQSSRRW